MYDTVYNYRHILSVDSLTTENSCFKERFILNTCTEHWVQNLLSQNRKRRICGVLFIGFCVGGLWGGCVGVCLFVTVVAQLHFVIETKKLHCYLLDIIMVNK